jgi:hypothetical protein
VETLVSVSTEVVIRYSVIFVEAARQGGDKYDDVACAPDRAAGENPKAEQPGAVGKMTSCKTRLLLSLRLRASMEM